MQFSGYEFNLVHSRKGGSLMVGELSNYLDDKLESGEYTETKDHYVCQCPHCLEAYKSDPTYNGVPYTKRKLYILKDGSTGFCFRCDRSFFNVSEELDLKMNLPSFSQEIKNYEIVKLPEYGSHWSLSKFDEFDYEDEGGLEYLAARNPYLRKLAPKLGIRYSNGDPVIPFYLNNELIYYQIRFRDKDARIKYFSPPISHKPPFVLEHGDNKDFIVCEGVFDALALLPQYPIGTPFAVLGSTITDYQLSILRSYIPRSVLVYMDETELSKGVAEKISRSIPYVNVGVIYSDGTDPEEKLNKLLRLEVDNLQWISQKYSF